MSTAYGLAEDHPRLKHCFAGGCSEWEFAVVRLDGLTTDDRDSIRAEGFRISETIDSCETPVFRGHSAVESIPHDARIIWSKEEQDETQSRLSRIRHAVDGVFSGFLT